MNINRWIRHRGKNWQLLDSLLRKVEQKELKSLPAA